MTCFISCDLIPKLSFSGKIYNSTGGTVKGAVVNFMIGNTSKYEVISDLTGQFDLSKIAKGTYTVTIKATGYNVYSEETTISEDVNKEFRIKGNANITGKVINSQTGTGLAQAIVSFTVDQNATSATGAELVVTTDSYGTYTITDGPTGVFTGFVEAPNYFQRKMETVTFTDGTNQIPPSTLVSQPDLGQLRIILTWGASPNDLDAHFTGPSSAGGKFHIYYSQKTTTGANLDVDDTYSYGPETVTISSFLPGTYRYSVYNYSNKTSTGGSGIASSPAKVEIYDHSGLLKSYVSPICNVSANTWRVFDIIFSGTNANIVTQNTYITASSSTNLVNFVKPANNQLKTDKKPLLFNIADF
jgi:hypothetical protein